MANFDIMNKVFFITGGAQGLGKKIIEGVLAKGAKVFFVDMQKQKGQETLEELQQRFGNKKVAFAHLDVTNRNDLEVAYKEATKEFGYVDIVLNNAAVMDEENTKWMLDVNLGAVVSGTEIATKYMRKDKGGRGGRIINMSSIVGVDYYYNMPTYCATKHAVRTYSTALSQNPSNKRWGMEFATLHPDASTVGIFNELRGKGIHEVEDIYASYEKQGTQVRPEEIVDAFINMVSLETMNGADLLVCKNKATFVKVERVDMGSSFVPSQ